LAESCPFDARTCSTWEAPPKQLTSMLGIFDRPELL